MTISSASAVRASLIPILLVAGLALAEDLEPAAFKSALEKKPGVVLDVRTPEEVAKGTLPGASVIDFRGPKFEQKVALLAKNTPVYVYCASGNRSGQAATLMTSKLGFTNVVNLSGGMRAWNAAGLPVESHGAPVASGSETTVAAFDALLSSHKKVLVDFRTPWCTPCQQMEPVVAGLKLPGVEVVKVDVDASEALAAREKVEGVPVFVFYEAGKEKRRLSGLQTAKALEGMSR